VGTESIKSRNIWQALRQAQRPGAAVILLCSLIACSDVSLFKNVTSNGPIEGKLCLDNPDTITSYTKFLFVVDQSGSNAGPEGTDPGGVKRRTGIDSFIDKMTLAGGNFQYGLILFSGDTAQVSDPAFTPEPLVAHELMSVIGQNDDNTTPYIGALAATHNTIQTDIAAHPDEKNIYFVIFVSDGSPCCPITDQPDPQIFQNVVDLVSNADAQISLSTGYYGKGNTEGEEERLKTMAKLGGGKYLDLESQGIWDFGELLGRNDDAMPWQMKYQVVVYNLNAGFAEDGRVLVDSDSDGLTDQEELLLTKRLGIQLDPSRRNSAGDGYGDYIRAVARRDGDTLRTCQDSSDADQDLLTVCEERYIQNDNPTPVTLPKHGDTKNPDTDGDGILDGMEVFSYAFGSLGYAMNDQNMTYSVAGTTELAGTRLLKHLSPQWNNDITPAYNTKVLPDGRGMACFNFKQTVLQLYPTLAVKAGETTPGLEHEAGVNVILVYYIQTYKKDTHGNGYLRYSLQKLKNDPSTLSAIASGTAIRLEPEFFKSFKFKISK
jgi:hypothetical protein